jgi:hypothetical protein
LIFPTVALSAFFSVSLGVTLLYLAGRAFSILFGSLGVFCVYFPEAAAHAVMFLSIVIALAWAEAAN